MQNIQEIQVTEEAQKVIKFKPKARKCGGNALKRRCNCYGMTLKYLFALKELTYQKVGDILKITPQAVNYLVNRSSEYNIADTFFLENLCRKLNIDYRYFMDLSEEVRKLI